MLGEILGVLYGVEFVDVTDDLLDEGRTLH
jgi:hypothetical protein